MDLTKLIDLIAEVAVRRATQKETKEPANPEAVLWKVLRLLGFTRPSPSIYRLAAFRNRCCLDGLNG